MFLEIITPDDKVFSGEVNGIHFPGSDGAFEVLNDHAPLISTLTKGNIRIRTSGKEENLVIDGGLVEVLDNKVIVLAEAIIEK